MKVYRWESGKKSLVASIKSSKGKLVISWEDAPDPLQEIFARGIPTASGEPVTPEHGADFITALEAYFSRSSVISVEA